ncbi:uncharacterized protein LOC129601462 isoform X2 [Paramacrobiotus metropolitanus]|uniref:uncharacterized protein LOC129601462 isoform X2 n=1 Tax=Paramacrobiotus metropolitanus TaxID=2943436 RepID=UPI00244604B2|nr:uncharacterized protein LOC129601462 isoform X2 [Paramacrobiotus metropolitanus]
MHLYGDLYRSVYAFNAVDVEVDGMLQHGHVIDVVDVDKYPQFLLVDFGCADHEPELCEYGKVFECSKELEKIMDEEWIKGYEDHYGYSTPDVEVLLRGHPDLPWQWFPAKIIRYVSLRLYTPDHALVEVEFNGCTARELLPLEQIRLRTTEAVLQSRTLLPGHFCIEVVSGERYLTTTAALAQSSTDRTKSFAENMERYFRFEYRRRLVSELRQMQRRRAVIPINMDMRDSSADGIALPVEILKEVFLALGTIDRQRCRRICPLWNEIIHQPEVCADIRVTLEAPLPIIQMPHEACWREERRNQQDYEREPTSSLDRVLNFLLKPLLDDGTVRIQRLILQRRRQIIHFHRHRLSDWFDGMVKLYAKFRSCCQRIIWANWSLGVTISRRGLTYTEYDMELYFPLAKFNLDSLNAAQFWELFENNLCGEAENVELVTKWWPRSILWRDFISRKIVAKILTKCQKGDPRPNAYYSDQKWTYDNLDSVDVMKLNKLGLRVLSWCMRKELAGSSEDSEADESQEDSESDDSSEDCSELSHKLSEALKNYLNANEGGWEQ